MSGFTFNKPPTTGQSSSSLFGATPSSNAPGSGNTAAGTAPKFSFGQPATTSATQPSLFGGSSLQTGTSGGFGGGAGSTFSFGKKPEGTTSNEAPKSLFAGFGTASTQSPATPGSSAPSLFGATTPVTTAAPTWSFGNPSTTPAGPPPQASAFGASTGGSGALGSSQPQQSTGTQEAAKPSLFSFAKPAATPATTNTEAAQSTTTPAFGASPAATGGIFGSKPSDSSTGTPAPSLFGSKTAGSSTTGSIFGAKPAAPSATGGMFGSTPASASAGGSIFGMNSTNPSVNSNIFGSKPSDKPADDKSNTSAAEPAKSTFSFGAPVNTAPSSTSSPSLFKMPATTSPTTSTAKPSQPTSNLFGAQSATPPLNKTPTFFTTPATTSANSQPTAPAFSFPTSSQPATTSASTIAPTAPSQKPLFGALPSSSTSTPAPLFGTAPASTTTTQATATTSAPAPAPGLFSLGAPSATPTSQPAAATTAPTSTAGGLGTTGGTTLGASTSALSGLGASTSGPLPPAQSRLKNKTMDEILTRWATDLSRYTKEFKNHAETIAQWDQIIVDNSSKIDKLYIKTRTCEKQTMSVDMQLAAVENQQNELESWLSKYENDVEEMLARGGANANEPGGPDQERERTYKLAEKLGEQLNGMGRDLESMVEEVNAANSSLSKHTKADEPITQIVRILNSHLTQLQTIDVGTAALQNKVLAAQKSAGSMGYTNGMNSEGRAAVDDFYRSYMGRR